MVAVSLSKGLMLYTSSVRQKGHNYFPHLEDLIRNKSHVMEYP